MCDELSSVRDDTLCLAPQLSVAGSTGQGLFIDQVPFRMNLSLVDPCPILEELGLGCQRARGGKELDALSAFLANLAVLPPGFRLFYSRDKNHYADLWRYRPSYYSYGWMLGAVDRLEHAELIEHWRTPRLPYPTFRSSIAPSPALAEFLSHVRASQLTVRPTECIVLRDHDRMPISYRDTPYTRQAREAVEAYNEWISGRGILVEHPDVTLDELGFLTVQGRRLPVSTRRVYRVFKGCFSRGGRWYGPFWQNLPSEIRRSGLRINGEPVVEEDYRACHLRILMHLAGNRSFVLSDDPFERPPHRRRDYKLAFNILLNAADKRKALHALAYQLIEGGAPDLVHARNLLRAVESAFPELRPYWCKSFGLRLQHVDSEICGRVLAQLCERSIPVLSVHDSFLVPVRHRQTLLETMEEAFEMELQRQC